MPLTTAHPIIVAPLWHMSRRWLDLPALIVGSMIPDITYFLWLRPVINIGHTPFGILVQGIPASLCLLCLFGWIMLGPLRALSPEGLGRVLPDRYAIFSATRLVTIVCSIGLGAATHVFWDSFTHDGWYFVRVFPVLDSEVGPLPIYKYLQYISGILGTAAVLIWAGLAARQVPVSGERIARRKVPFIIVGVTLLIVTSLALSKPAELSPHTILVQSVIGVIAGASLGLFLFACVDKIRPFKRDPINP